MSDFSKYMKAQDQTRAAIAVREAASYNLTLCKIRERACEVASQSDPIVSILNNLGISYSICSDDYKKHREAFEELIKYVVFDKKIELKKKDKND